MKLRILLLTFLSGFILNSCGLPKETLQRLNSKEREDVNLPYDYSLLFPSLKFEEWDKDYNTFYKYLTKEVWQTQAGLSFVFNGVEYWSCVPSAQTHVQLDTAAMINDNGKIYGEWRCVCDRLILFTDSANHADRKIYRKSQLQRDGIFDDLYLTVSSENFKMYAKKNASSNYRRMANSRYKIINKRILLLYEIAKAGGRINFIGLDSEDRLIIISFNVQERKIKGVYNVYQASMAQTIFKRMS